LSHLFVQYFFLAMVVAWLTLARAEVEATPAALFTVSAEVSTLGLAALQGGTKATAKKATRIAVTKSILMKGVRRRNAVHGAAAALFAIASAISVAIDC
jgi:hypothetical protein